MILTKPPTMSLPAPAPKPAAPAPADPGPAPRILSALEKYTRATEAQKNMVLISGGPVTGKTYGARTFPNPIIIDVDNNLPPGVPNVIPLWDADFVNSVIKQPNEKWAANRRDALDIILTDLTKELTAGQTLILDSLTRLEVYYNMQENDEPKPVSEKKGGVDGHALWRKRLDFFNKLCTRFQGCKAQIVFIVHTQFEKDEKGNLTSNIRAALQGQIGDQLTGYFPTSLFTVRETDPKDPSKVNFLWRIRPNMYTPARVPKPADREFIPQDYNELKKYL